MNKLSKAATESLEIWSEPKYSWSYARLPAGELAAGYNTVSRGDPTGYTAIVFGRIINGLYGSLEDAQRAAEAVAMRTLKASIAELEDNG